MYEITVAVVSGALVGLSLGLTGSGGSLFAIPLLLYVLGFDMAQAVPISLLVVGAVALLGAVSAYNKHLLLTRPTILFGVAGILSSPLGIKLGAFTPEFWRVSGFAVLALLMSARMAWQSFNTEASRVVRASVELEDKTGICRFASEGELRFTLPCAVAIVTSGLLVGVLSGFFGVGGGFLIVPALMFVLRLDITRAVGSSLAIIAMIGLSSGALNGMPLLLSSLPASVFAVGSLLGMFGGRVISNKIAGPHLQRIFALALCATGIFMIAKS